MVIPFDLNETDAGKSLELVANLTRHGSRGASCPPIVYSGRRTQLFDRRNRFARVSLTGPWSSIWRSRKGALRARCSPRTLRWGAEFYQRQLDRAARNLKRGRHEPDESPEFYDMTAWCLPLAFGVDAAYSATALPELGSGHQHLIEPGPVNQQLLEEQKPRPGSTAYIWVPGTEGAYRLAFRLLQDGYHVATTIYPLRCRGP